MTNAKNWLRLILEPRRKPGMEYTSIETTSSVEESIQRSVSAAARGPFCIPAKEFDATLGVTWEKALLQLPFLLEQVSVAETNHHAPTSPIKA